MSDLFKAGICNADGCSVEAGQHGAVAPAVEKTIAVEIVSDVISPSGSSSARLRFCQPA
jgi:hypothetical protein